MHVDTLPVGLGLDPEEAQARFDELQQKLVPLWQSMEGMTQDEQTIVVVCSMTLDEPNMPAAVLQAYEERFLFLLLLLRQPRARLVYVTSQAIHPSIVDYYLGLLPGIIPSHARQRLHLVSPLDGSSRPLSAKLLERPRLLEQIRGLIPDPDRAHLVPFNTTELERDLALALGIPMYGADPRFFPYGTKTGCRRLFAGAGRSASARARGPVHDRRAGGGDRRAARRAAGHVPGDREAQRGRLGRGQRAAQPRRAVATARAPNEIEERLSRDAVRAAGDHVRRLHRHAGEAWRRGRGADRRRGVPQPERPDARDAARQARAALDARPAARRAERAELSRLHLPGRPRVRDRDHAGGGEGRRAARVGGRDRPLRDGLRRRQGRGRRLGAVRDRAQPPQGRHDAPVPHAAVPHGRRVRPGDGGVHGPERQAEVLRRLRPCRERPVPRADGRRPLRPRRAAPASTSTSRARPASSST